MGNDVIIVKLEEIVLAVPFSAVIISTYEVFASNPVNLAERETISFVDEEVAGIPFSV